MSAKKVLNKIIIHHIDVVTKPPPRTQETLYFLSRNIRIAKLINCIVLVILRNIYVK